MRERLARLIASAASILLLIGTAASAHLSSETKCNTPADLISAGLIKTSGSVAMRCYSHLSDDQKRTDWSGQSFRPIRSARSPERSAVRSRPSGANSAATVCRAGATRRFTPPEPINCACGVKRRSKEIEPYGPSLSTGSRKGGPPSKFQAGSRAETNLVCGPWVARRSTPVRRRDERVGERVTSGAARKGRDASGNARHTIFVD
jgi:hypothetical protein